MSRALAAYDPCGCCAAISVMDGHDPSRPYEMAAEQAKKGRRIVDVDVAEWKQRPMFCADHPDGPPWWKSRGGNGRVPATYEPQLTLALP